jgi:DNA-binding XRE family transcriptional regulator
MAQSKQFIVNGIEVTAVPVGNGMWCGVPNDPIGLLLKILSGQVDLASLSSVEEVQEVQPNVEPEPEVGYTLREYRENEGMSKTQFAEYIGVSRRSLGRYEDAGRLASEFGL